MTLIIRFEGLSSLPNFRPKEEFFAAVEKLISEDKFTVLNNDDSNDFDASIDDTALAMDFPEKDYTVISSEILFEIFKSKSSSIELLSDKIADTASGAKRRTIMIAVTRAKESNQNIDKLTT